MKWKEIYRKFFSIKFTSSEIQSGWSLCIFFLYIMHACFNLRREEEKIVTLFLCDPEISRNTNIEYISPEMCAWIFVLKENINSWHPQWRELKQNSNFPIGWWFGSVTDKNEWNRNENETYEIKKLVINSFIKLYFYFS